MYNDIYLRRALKVFPHDSTGDKATFAQVASLDANLRTLGYTMDGDLAVHLLQSHNLRDFEKKVVPVLKEMKGVRNYRPMYPNFPKQVMEASEAELYVNAMLHYWNIYGPNGSFDNEAWFPQYDKADRPVLDFDESKYEVIRLGSHKDFIALMASIMSSKSAFSQADKDDLTSLANGDFALTLFRVDEFANRENKAWLAARLLFIGGDLIRLKFDTATDVLRLAVAMSDGDVSLAEHTKFRSFKRSERRMLLDALNKVGSNLVEDMSRNEIAWKRLGERLHPGEYADRYPAAYAGFNSLRNDTIETFNSRVEKALEKGDALGAADILSERPGEFSRRLDHVLRTAPVGDQASIIRMFNDVSEKVSPTVLLQTRNAFSTRDRDVRVAFPKGSVAKAQVIDDTRQPLSKIVRQQVESITTGALHEQFGTRASLGKCWVDPALKGVAIPFGLRNASKQLKTLGRGSRLPLDMSTGVIRFFIWWVGRDVDLSAVGLDKNFNHVEYIGYHNLRGHGAVHSGDIVWAPNGASEFIDIDVEQHRKRGIRYVAMTVNSYSGEPFADMDECFAGFMQRDGLGNEGEIYDPRTVTNKVDLTVKSRGATPFVFDLVTGEAVWVDLSFQINGYNSVYGNGNVTDIIRGLVDLNPPSLYDLFFSHAMSRGGLTTRENADVVFAFDGDVTPFDVEEILDKYL